MGKEIIEAKDLTVIYYTANTVKEQFGERVRQILLKAIGSTPLISVSQEPLDFGQNICVGKLEKSVISVYRQILVGAKAARTPFVALAEDDTLYPPHHFLFRRPTEFAYDRARWSVRTWAKPVFSMHSRDTNSGLIAPTALLIEALEERFDKYPDNIQRRCWSEPGHYEVQFGLRHRDAMSFFSTAPFITFDHPESLGYASLGRRKAAGPVQAFELPYWGRAEDILNLYMED